MSENTSTDTQNPANEEQPTTVDVSAQESQTTTDQPTDSDVDTSKSELNVDEPVILDPERSEYIANGETVYLRDGKTIRADRMGNTYEVDGDYVDIVIAVSNLFSDKL